MKRLFLSIATVALAVGFISCEKNIADDTSTVAKTYKVNFSVSDKPSFDNTTRASKEGWTDGDQILVMLRPSTANKYLIAANDNSKTLKLTYNGSKWTPSTISDEMMQALDTSGDCYAVYYRGNVGIGAEDPGSEDCYVFANYKGGEYYYSSGSYTVADDVLTLTQIEMEKGTDIFQISVNDLLSTTENQAKSWKLAILRDATQKLPIPDDFDKNDDVYYEGMAEGYFMFDGGKTSPQQIFYATSVQNDNDATFWFWHPFYGDDNVVNDKTEARYENGYFFTLTDGTTTYYYKVDRNLNTANEKTLNPKEAYLLPQLSLWTTREDAVWDRTEPITPQPSGDE